VEAAATALAACVLTATSSFTSVDGGEIGDVRSSAPLTLIVVALVVFVALVAARGGETLALMMPAGLRQVLSELAALTTVAGLVMGGLVVPGTVIGALSNGDGPLILALPVYLPNLALYTLSLGCLGGLTVTGASSSGSLADAGIQSLLRNVEPVYAWDVLGGVSVLLFLALLVVVLAAAARVGVRRVRLVRPDLTRTWALGAAVLVVGVVVLNLLLPLRLSGGLLGQPVSGAAGATWSAGLTLGIVGMIVSVLAEYVPAWLYTSATGLLTLCAGRSAVSAWLAGSSGQRANRPPGPAPSTAAGAVPPPPAPMSPKTRRRLRTGVGVLSLVLVLVVAAVVAVHVLNSRHSPDKEVATYLNLLADGHAQAANEMVDPGVSNDKRLLLTDEALGAATSRITSIPGKDADGGEVIAIRRKLLPPQAGETLIEASAFDTGWMEDVSGSHPDAQFFLILEGVLTYFDNETVGGLFKNLAHYFHHGEAVFDVSSSWMVKNSGKHDAVKHTRARFAFGCDDDREIERWADNLHLISAKYMATDFPAWKRLGLFYWIMRLVPVLRNSYRLLHYRID